MPNAHLLFNRKKLDIKYCLNSNSIQLCVCLLHLFYFRYRPKISQFGDKETILVVHHSFSGSWTINTWICLTALMHMVNIKHATDIFQTKIWVWQTRDKELSGFSGVIRPKMPLYFLMDPYSSYLTVDSFCLLSRIWLTISTSCILQKD